MTFGNIHRFQIRNVSSNVPRYMKTNKPCRTRKFHSLYSCTTKHLIIETSSSPPSLKFNKNFPTKTLPTKNAPRIPPSPKQIAGLFFTSNIFNHRTCANIPFTGQPEFLSSPAQVAAPALHLVLGVGLKLPSSDAKARLRPLFETTGGAVW